MVQILTDILLVSGISVLTAALALWSIQRIPARPVAQQNAATGPEAVALLFENGILHHATQTAAHTLEMEPGTHDWEDLWDTLVGRFPNFPRMAHSGSRGSQTLDAVDGQDPEQVRIRWRGDLCWVSLSSVPPEQAHTPAQRAAIGHLGNAAASSPHAAWAVDGDGNVIWQNGAYCALIQRLFPDEAPQSFTPFETPDPGSGPVRTRLLPPDGSPTEWYEVTCEPVGDVTYLHAKCVTAQCQAEEAKRTFVQTLSKTFAHLPTGLAIFDRNGQLALFNPALVDLTGLSAVFLSGRPTMISFFDQLREHRRMPEPKNYASWREEIADMILAAADGRYQETWSLEGGQTFSVQGRPHPDGATAFLIEDISAEVQLTRNFRAELELGQALFDSFEEALVVFSPAGVLTFSNDAYRIMWDQNPDGAFADVTIADAISAWQDRAAADAPWPVIADFVSGAEHHQHKEVALPLKDATTLRCRMHVIATGARLIRFDRSDPPAQPALENDASLSV